MEFYHFGHAGAIASNAKSKTSAWPTCELFTVEGNSLHENGFCPGPIDDAVDVGPLTAHVVSVLYPCR